MVLLLGMPWASACHSSGERDVKASAPTTPGALSASSASHDADAPRAVLAELGATMKVVARVRNRHAGLRRAGPGQVQLDAGVFVYAGRNNGELERLGELSSYPHGGDDLVGPGAGAPSSALRTKDNEERIAQDADGTSITVRNVQLDVGEGPREECTLVPAADGHVYATCRHGEVPLVLRTPNAWVRVERANALKVGTDPRLAVARDGAIWAWEEAGVLTRVLPDGRREQITLPRMPDQPARPSYEGSYPEMMSATWARGADGGVRFWQSTKVVGARPPQEISAISTVLPLADGSVWALGWERGYTEALVVLRAGVGSDAPAAPIEIGTPFDQENEARNATAPRPWTARCPQVFVAFDVESHQKEAAAALLARKHRITVDVVSGRLAGRAESGVLLLRSEPESSPVALEAAVASLLMVPRAEAFCTAPILERILDPR